jgi:hypothetical protein
MCSVNEIGLMITSCIRPIQTCIKLHDSMLSQYMFKFHTGTNVVHIAFQARNFRFKCGLVYVAEAG